MPEPTLESLIGAERIDALMQPIARAQGLPNAAYTSEAFSDLEQQRLFARNWVCIGTLFDLPERGSAFPVDVGPVPLIMVRAKDGGVRVFHNVCRHRGNLLMSAPATKCQRIVCRYHGWAYDLDGTLRSTPQFNGPGEDWPRDGRDRGSLGLKPVRTALWHHWVFVNLDGKAVDFEDFSAPFAAHFDGYPFDQLRCNGDLAFKFAANWKLVAENFLEALHIQPVHRGLFERFRELYTTAASSTRTKGAKNDYFSICLDLPDGYSAKTCRLPVLPNISTTWLNRHEYLLLFPNLILFALPDHLISIIEQPRGPAQTVQRWHFCFAPHALANGDHANEIKALQTFWTTVNEEDITVCESMQKGRGSPAVDHSVFSPYWEDLTLAFQRRVVERLRA